MNAAAPAENVSERANRLAAFICRECDSIERTVNAILASPVRVCDLLAFVEDPLMLRADVPFAAAHKVRQAYDELVELVGELALVWDCVWNVEIAASTLAPRVAACEAAVAQFEVLRRSKR